MPVGAAASLTPKPHDANSSEPPGFGGGSAPRRKRAVYSLRPSVDSVELAWVMPCRKRPKLGSVMAVQSPMQPSAAAASRASPALLPSGAVTLGAAVKDRAVARRRTDAAARRMGGGQRRAVHRL